MNELKLHPLTCPQCGAPGVVREGTRITDCERCGARLCISHLASPKYEAIANLGPAQAITAARAWMQSHDQTGIPQRPELVLVPYHEIAGRRVGIFERKVPDRERVHRTIYSAHTGESDVESKWVYTQREDTKIMVSDVQHLAVAAKTPWHLGGFDAAEARRRSTLRDFDLVEAQRRATVYTEERTTDEAAALRFADRGAAEMVATSRRTILFPFWAIPVRTPEGEYEIVVDGIGGNVIAGRMPQSFPMPSLSWAGLAVVGALLLGQAFRAILFDGAVIDPVIAGLAGAGLTGLGLSRTNWPDWSIRSWPEADTLAGSDVS